MKNKKIHFYVLCLLVVLWSCNAGTVEKAGIENNITESSEVQEGDKPWQQILAEKTPLDKEELYKLFPQKLGDFSLVDINDNAGTNGAIARYNHDIEAGDLAPHISLLIIDGAGYGGFAHVNAVYKILESGISEKNEKEWSRIEEMNNQKMIFNDKNARDRITSGISFIKNLRYHITIEGNRISSDDLRDPAKEILGLTYPE